MTYAIMRCKKLKGMGSVAAALKHCYRERETPNADPRRLEFNEHRAARRTSEAIGRMRDLLPEKRRKDAVLAVEYVCTASPEWWKKATWEQQHEFFKRAEDWLAEKYGRDRIITATIHKDETSPHLSAFVVPLMADGRLSAKEFIGNREKMKADQTTFAKKMQDLGLKRGIEGSKAQHTTIKSYYAALERPKIDHGHIIPSNLEPRPVETRDWKDKARAMVGIPKKETPEQVAARLSKDVQTYYDPAIKTAAVAQEEAKKRQQAIETARHYKTAYERLKPLEDALKGLPADHQQLAVQAFYKAADKLHEHNAAQRREQEQKRAQERSRDTGGLSR